MTKNEKHLAVALGITVAINIASEFAHRRKIREIRREAHEERVSHLRFISYMDQLSGVKETLDEKIRIAKKALEEDDFRNITDNF